MWCCGGSLVLAILAGIMGFGDLSTRLSGMAKVLFFVFLAIFVVSTGIAWAARRRAPSAR